MTYFKAVRPDGASFHDRTVMWTVGEVTTHPNPREGKDPSGYLSVSTEPADCTGMRWPCRLLVVEPVDGHPVWTPHPKDMPHKRAAHAWRVVEE